MEFHTVQPMPPTNWVPIETVMAHLGVRSKVTMTKLIKEGLPAHRVGARGYRFDLIEVDAWIRASSRWNTPRPDDEGVA